MYDEYMGRVVSVGLKGVVSEVEGDIRDIKSDLGTIEEFIDVAKKYGHSDLLPTLQEYYKELEDKIESLEKFIGY